MAMSDAQMGLASFNPALAEPGLIGQAIQLEQQRRQNLLNAAGNVAQNVKNYQATQDVRDAYQASIDPTTGALDSNKFMSNLFQSNPQAAVQQGTTLANGFNDTEFKNLQNQHQQLTDTLAKMNQLGDLASSVVNAPPEQQQGMLGQMKQYALQNGLMNADTANLIQTPQDLRAMIPMSMKAYQQLQLQQAKVAGQLDRWTNQSSTDQQKVDVQQQRADTYGNAVSQQAPLIQARTNLANQQTQKLSDQAQQQEAQSALFKKLQNGEITQEQFNLGLAAISPSQFKTYTQGLKNLQPTPANQKVAAQQMAGLTDALSRVQTNQDVQTLKQNAQAQGMDVSNIPNTAEEAKRYALTQSQLQAPMTPTQQKTYNEQLKGANSAIDTYQNLQVLANNAQTAMQNIIKNNPAMASWPEYALKAYAATHPGSDAANYLLAKQQLAAQSKQEGVILMKSAGAGSRMGQQIELMAGDILNPNNSNMTITQQMPILQHHLDQVASMANNALGDINRTAKPTDRTVKGVYTQEQLNDLQKQTGMSPSQARDWAIKNRIYIEP